MSLTDDDEASGTGPPSPERVARLVDSLASVMHQAQVTELDLELGQLTIRLRRPSGTVVIESGPTVLAPALEVPRQEAVHEITAPMVGTFYISPTPSAAPFVAVGDIIVAGQTIGIIEAMKIMNEITADRGGVVQALLASNAEAVEYGSPLIRLALGPDARR